MCASCPALATLDLKDATASNSNTGGTYAVGTRTTHNQAETSSDVLSDPPSRPVATSCSDQPLFDRIVMLGSRGQITDADNTARAVSSERTLPEPGTNSGTVFSETVSQHPPFSAATNVGSATSNSPPFPDGVVESASGPLTDVKRCGMTNNEQKEEARQSLGVHGLGGSEKVTLAEDERPGEEAKMVSVGDDAVSLCGGQAGRGDGNGDVFADAGGVFFDGSGEGPVEDEERKDGSVAVKVRPICRSAVVKLWCTASNMICDARAPFGNVWWISAGWRSRAVGVLHGGGYVTTLLVCALARVYTTKRRTSIEPMKRPF